MPQDWPRHRVECTPARNQDAYSVNAVPPPVEQQLMMVSAILFAPEDGPFLISVHGFGDLIDLFTERPRVVTVNCKPASKTSHGMCPIPILPPHFNDEPTQSIVLTQGLNGEPLRFPLQLWYAPNLLNKGSPVNRAIFHITSGAAEKPWSGPVVVLKYNGSRRQGYSDAGSNDLPALSAYFLSYK